MSMHVRLDAQDLGSVNDYCIPGRALAEETILVWCLTKHIHFSNTLYACLNPKLNNGRLQLDNMPIGKCTLTELKRLCPTCLRLPLITMKFGD